MNINGAIVDTNIVLPVYGAKAYLIRVSDSVIVSYQNTKEDGVFHFDVPIDNYQLFLSHPKYNDKQFLLVGTSEKRDFNLGEINLPDKSMQLEGVTIVAYKDPVYYNGDTLVFIADSFATKDNAVVEDLLKKLPGVTVNDDGSITSNGRTVDKVYVDGDEFFGSDPTTATKNLAAKSIDRVQVYEVDPEDGSVSDDKIQVLDLRLKEDAKKGWFGKVNAATDFYQFGEGQLLFNRFNNKQKIFAFGIGSNTLNSAISSKDAQATGVSGSVARNTNNSGYPTTFKAGVLFSDQVSEKLKFSGDYSFSDSRVKKENESATQYLLSDTTYYSQLQSNQNNHSQNHNLSLDFNIKLDSTSGLTIKPDFSINFSNNSNDKITNYLNEESDSVRRALNNSISKSSGYSISNMLSYRKDFKKKGRHLNLRDNISYAQTNEKSNLDYYDLFFANDSTANEIQQQKDNKTIIFANTLSASYSEPLSTQWKLIFDYELYNNNNAKNQYSYNYDGVDYTLVDSSTTSVFRTNKLQNKLGVSANFRDKKNNLSFGVHGRNLLVDNRNLFNQQAIHQNFTTALPYLRYRLKISQNSNFSARINTNSSLPTIDMVSPVTDNTNPNSILVGNENLKPNYDFSTNISYMLYKPISSISFSVGIGASYTFNDFAKSVDYDSLGRSVAHYENINTFNNWSANTQLSIPLFKKIVTINPRFTYTNSQQNNIVENTLNKTITNNFMPELRLIVFTNFLEFNTSLSLTQQLGKNSNDASLNINNSIWNFKNNLKVNLPWKLDVELVGNYYNYQNLSQTYSSKFFILNASITKRIGKYDQWSIGVEGYDLLNNNTQVERTITLNTIVDSRTNIIARYFLFRVTYTFNSTLQSKQKQKDESFK